MRTRNSIRGFVRPSVRRLVRRGDRVEKVRKRAFPPMPTRPRQVLAVFPALVSFISFPSLFLISGIIVSRLSDSYPHSFFTGLLEIGDQILKIDEQKVCSSRIPSCYFVSVYRVVLFFILVELFCYFVISCLK